MVTQFRFPCTIWLCYSTQYDVYYSSTVYDICKIVHAFVSMQDTSLLSLSEGWVEVVYNGVGGAISVWPSFV